MPLGGYRGGLKCLQKFGTDCRCRVFILCIFRSSIFQPHLARCLSPPWFLCHILRICFHVVCCSLYWKTSRGVPGDISGGSETLHSLSFVIVWSTLSAPKLSLPL